MMIRTIIKLTLFVFYFLILLQYSISCKPSHRKEDDTTDSQALITEHLQKNEIGTGCNLRIKSEALLSSRFKNIEELKTHLSIIYDRDYSKMDSNDCGHSVVTLNYLSNGEMLSREMTSGVSQTEILKLQKADYLKRCWFVLNNPSTIRQRNELEKAYLLARRHSILFGPGDVSFYDLAEASFRHINTPQLAFLNTRDSSEKGYINTFNHVTAQALISSLFSERLADFIGDLHERYNMPEITSGRFSNLQLNDTLNNPADNYVDIINNEIGQKIGLQLKEKYNLNEKTTWTPVLLAAYLNDIQSYYMWAMEIGLNNFRPTDEFIIKFSNKINSIMNGSWVSVSKAVTGY